MHLSVKYIVTTGALATALLLGGTESAVAQAGGDAPAIVTLRKALMQSNVQHVNALRALLSGDVNLPLHVLKHTAALEDNGFMLRQLFTEGSTHASSRAMDDIWSNGEEFAARARAFATATENLNAVAQRGFNDQTEAALTAMRQTCGACHSAFRGPARPSD